MTVCLPLQTIIEFTPKILSANGSLFLYKPPNAAFNNVEYMLPYYEIKKSSETFTAEFRFIPFPSRESVLYDYTPKQIHIEKSLNLLIQNLYQQGYTVIDFISAFIIYLEDETQINPCTIFNSYVEALLDHTRKNHFYSGCVVIMIHLTRCINEYEVSDFGDSFVKFLDSSGSSVDSKDKEIEWIENMSKIVLKSMLAIPLVYI